MKARINSLNCEQRKIINHEVRKNVAEEMQKIQLDFDALFLLAMRRTFGLGAKRLRRAYEEYFKLREEFIEFYESDGFDSYAEIAAMFELRAAGFDIKKEYEKIGTTRVDYRFTKGESQAMREARERTNQ